MKARTDITVYVVKDSNWQQPFHLQNVQLRAIFDNRSVGTPAVIKDNPSGHGTIPLTYIIDI